MPARCRWLLGSSPANPFVNSSRRSSAPGRNNACKCRSKVFFVARNERVPDTAVNERRSHGDALSRSQLIDALHKALAYPIEAASVGRVEAPSAIVNAMKRCGQFVAQP